MTAASPIREVWLANKDDVQAKPATYGDLQTTEPLLHKCGVTQQMWLFLSREDESQNLIALYYISRGVARDVWGGPGVRSEAAGSRVARQF
jgi:hypothetical protein